MIKTIFARVRQKHRTMAFPDGPAPALPDRFRGLPKVDTSKCPDGCRECVSACPTEAITIDESGYRLDLGKCLFCTECMDACPSGAIEHTTDHRLASSTREGLVLSPGKELELARALDEKLMKLFGRSLRLRVVSAGGCNGCEADVNVLSTIVWDIGRFGIQVVASPRHSDGLLITGPVTENMRLALEKAYAAVPSPKIVIAVGACAISGGPFYLESEQHGGAGALGVPIDLYIPGCPPHPMTMLDGLLRLLGRLEEGKR